MVYNLLHHRKGLLKKSTAGARKPILKAMRKNARHPELNVITVGQLAILQNAVRRQVIKPRRILILQKLRNNTLQVLYKSVIHGSRMATQCKRQVSTCSPVDILKCRKKLLIQFGIKLDCDFVEKNVNSIDKKVILKLDTNADANALNKKTYRIIFPDVELVFKCNSKKKQILAYKY